MKLEKCNNNNSSQNETRVLQQRAAGGSDIFSFFFNVDKICAKPHRFELRPAGSSQMCSLVLYNPTATEFGQFTVQDRVQFGVKTSDTFLPKVSQAGN